MLTRLSTAVRGKHRSLPSIWLMTDSERMPDPVAMAKRLPQGAAVILRHRESDERRRLAIALVAVCRARTLHLFIAADWRLAARVRCRGVHLSETDARRGPSPGLRLWRRHRWLSVAAHGAGSIHRAELVGADATILGAVLPTRSHVGRRPLGRVKTAGLVRAADGPVIALGGLNRRTLVQLNGIPIAGVAGVGFIVPE